MPLGCSDPQARAALAALLVAVMAGGAGAASGTAAAGGGWGAAVFPVLAFERYSGGVGWRQHPLLPGRRPHEGIDIAAPEGSPVRSWWRGRVAEVIDERACGVGLRIRSGDYDHLYCHLAGRVVAGAYHSNGTATASDAAVVASDPGLRPGDAVQTGQLIARVGRSGLASGPHLHWSLRWRGLLLDPLAVLRAMAGGRAGSGSSDGWSRP